MSISEIQKYIDEKKPVIVLIQAWSNYPTNYHKNFKYGHYVIAIGYDENYLYFKDP